MIKELLGARPEWQAVDHSTGTKMSGPVRIQTRSGRVFTFEIELDVPSAFPHPNAHPRVEILKHDLGVRLGRDAHVNGDQSLCVQMPERHEIPYETARLVGFLDQVIIHLDRARIQAFTSRFPGDEYGHGHDGVREYERERIPLRAAFNQKVEALCSELPERLRRLGDSRVGMLAPRSPCPCGSGERLKECHWDAVVYVRRQTQALGPGPEVARRPPRNPFRPPRR